MEGFIMRSELGLLTAIATAGLLALSSSGVQADGWVGSWGASVVFPVGPDVNFQTLRQFVRLSAGGKRVRVHFSNATGQYQLVIGAAHVAKPAADGAPGAIDPASDHALTFGGNGGVIVAPGAEMVSDPVEIDLPPLSTLAISMFVPRWTGPAVIHLDGVATTYISDDGDFTSAAAMPSPHTSTSRFFIDEVDVEAAGQPGTLVTLGDSITDGYHSKVDGNHRWPDRLAERLAAQSNAAPIGVVNAGVSGNRILHDHPEELFGPTALARLDRDVLSTPGLRWVVLMEGINDIGHSTSAGLPEQDVTADQIVAGMKQIIARVHARGAKIYGATLTPYEGTIFHGYYQPEGEAKREAVNNWIRKGDFDAVIDFDAVVRDPDHPNRIRAEYDVGDHLHPNDAGYRAMGEAVDLKLFE
jgi:lysophospholipase L1-like esterase